MPIPVQPADIKQRQDAAALLPVAIADREEYVKLAMRLENNMRVFLERSNYELAALARVIAQKDENIATLKTMAGGFFVEPTAPIIARDGREAPVQPAERRAVPEAPEVPKQPEEKKNTPRNEREARMEKTMERKSAEKMNGTVVKAEEFPDEMPAEGNGGVG